MCNSTDIRRPLCLIESAVSSRNLGRPGAAALEPDELASNLELRGVMETLCNSLKEAKKVDKVCLTPPTPENLLNTKRGN